jgi:tripartite-type tricarboxylate transporter receptor subunit TctC
MKNWMNVGCWVLLIAASLALATPAAAQPYPNRPIRLINPYAAGGPFDMVARELAKPMGEILGTQVVVENRPGAGATIGADVVAKTEPNGYTLLLSGSPSHIIVPASMPKAPYDGIADFTPVALVATVPNLIVAKPSLGIKDLAGLVAYAKANPGKLSYGSPGPGSIGHLSMELFKRMAGVDMVHVPYKGAAPAVTDLLGGQVDIAMLNISAVLPHIRSGKMNAVAMGTKKRAELLPDLATIEEGGFRGYDAGTWYGVFGPAHMPNSVVSRLYQAISKVVATPDFKSRLQQQQGADVTLMTPQELGVLLQKERSELVPLIRQLGLKIE